MKNHRYRVMRLRDTNVYRVERYRPASWWRAGRWIPAIQRDLYGHRHAVEYPVEARCMSWIERQIAIETEAHQRKRGAWDQIGPTQGAIDLDLIITFAFVVAAILALGIWCMGYPQPDRGMLMIAVVAWGMACYSVR